MQAAATFAQAVRKTAVRCAESPGFIVGRVLASAAAELGAEAERLADAYGDRFLPSAEPDDERARLKGFVEACLMLQEAVAGVRDIDTALMLGGGVVPGPFAEADQRGLDVTLAALEAAEDAWGERFEPPLILRRLVSQGRLGV